MPHSTRYRMRYLIAVLLALTLILSSFPMLSMRASAVSHGPIYAKTTASVNLRSGMSTNASVLQVVKKNTTFTMLDRSDPQWYKIRLSDGTVGYIYSTYTDIINDCKTSTYVNFRTGPSTNSSIICTLATDTVIDILAFSGKSWLKGQLADGTVGYICTDYVTYIEDGTAVSAAAPLAAVNNFAISDTMLKVAKGRKAYLTVSGAKGAVVWSSTDAKIAEVTDEGVVIGRKAGTATVAAVNGQKTVFCNVTVVQTDYRFIYLDASSKTLEEGASFTLTGRTEPEGGKYTLTSSNTSVATVTSKGVVKGVGGGTAVITASDSTGIITATCKITVNPKAKITLAKSSESVNAGSAVRIGITKEPSDLSVTWTSSNTSVAAVNNGLVSGLKAGTAVITAADPSGKVKAKCTVTVNAVSTGGVRLSRYSASATAGKTIYIKGFNGAKWQTSDSAIATVWDGFIETKKAGKVAISYTDYYGQKAICVVTVSDAAPVKFCYSSPNSATMSSKVTLIAITDKKRTGVYFTVKDGENPTSVTATKKVAEGNTYVWKATYTPVKPGKLVVRAYAKYQNEWETCTDGKSDVYITDKTNAKTTSLEKLRASDKVIQFIGDKEGFVSNITYDTLADNLPTLGHGYVVWEGQSFYDHLTKSEGYALLVKAVNEEVYTTRVNEMLVANNIRFNQQQFDALVSFSYNLGTGWTYGSDLKTILLNSYGQVSDNSTTMTGRVTAENGLNLRSSPSSTANVIRVLNYNERVTLVSTTKYNSVWYQVKTSDGTVGYCSSSYLNVSATTGGTYVARDLNNVNRNALITEVLAYHHAGGVCYYGLLYRRADELEMFLYNDYEPDGRSNKHRFPNPPCISFP